MSFNFNLTIHIFLNHQTRSIHMYTINCVGHGNNNNNITGKSVDFYQDSFSPGGNPSCQPQAPFVWGQISFGRPPPKCQSMSDILSLGSGSLPRKLAPPPSTPRLTRHVGIRDPAAPTPPLAPRDPPAPAFSPRPLTLTIPSRNPLTINPNKPNDVHLTHILFSDLKPSQKSAPRTNPYSFPSPKSPSETCFPPTPDSCSDLSRSYVNLAAASLEDLGSTSAGFNSLSRSKTFQGAIFDSSKVNHISSMFHRTNSSMTESLKKPLLESSDSTDKPFDAFENPPPPVQIDFMSDPFLTSQPKAWNPFNTISSGPVISTNPVITTTSPSSILHSLVTSTLTVSATNSVLRTTVSMERNPFRVPLCRLPPRDPHDTLRQLGEAFFVSLLGSAPCVTNSRDCAPSVTNTNVLDPLSTASTSSFPTNTLPPMKTVSQVSLVFLLIL